MFTYSKAVLFLAALPLISLLAGCTGGPEGPVQAAAPNPVAVHVTTVETAARPRMLVAVGTVSAQFVTDLSARAQERVTAITVREGDPVRRGQPLVFLDTRDLDASQAAAAAAVRASVAQWESASTAATMASATSAAQIRSAQAQVAEARAAFTVAQAKQQAVDAGPRPQERRQAAQAAERAQAQMALAQKTYARMATLYQEEAITAQQYDVARSDRDAAQAAYQEALQQQSLTDEGSRTEDKAAAVASVAQARAALAAASAQLAQARADAQVLAVRQADVRQAQARIGQAQAGLQTADIQRSDASVVAPYDGVVVSRLADPGMMAGPGVPLLRLQGGSLRLDVAIPESAVESVPLSGTIPVSLDALGGRPVPARVLSLSPQGDTASHTFLVKTLLPDIPGLRAGMFGRAYIRTGQDREMRLPAEAVVSREGLTYVYVVSGGIAHLRLISVGAQQGKNVVVLSGLQNGEQVAVSDLDRLSDGTPVSEVR